MSLNLNKYALYSKRLMFVSFGMIIFLLISFIFYNYHKTLSTFENAELNKLSAIAKTLVLEIDGDEHEQFLCEYLSSTDKDLVEESQYYKDTYTMLKTAEEANNLGTPIYSVFKRGMCNNMNASDQQLLFGVSSGQFIYGNFWNVVPNEVFNFYDEGYRLHKYRTENGIWLSAFQAIKNSSNKTVGILQIDRSFDEFLAQAKQEAVHQSILASLLLGLVGSLFLFYYRRVLRFMNKINGSLHHMNEELEEKVKVRTSAIAEANDKLEDSNKKLESFAYRVSHDLKAPIRNINIFSKLLGDKYEPLLDKQGKEFIGFIVSSTENLTVLISDILSKAVASNEAQQKIASIDLNKIMDEIIGNLKIDIDSKNAIITYKNLPSIYGYKSDFVQLFQNLVSNSLKYSREDVDCNIKITSKNENGFHLISVEDNGQGIAKDALRSIFNEWDRGDAKDNEGHGVGLSTCKKIVKEYDGKMMVDSEVGVGSTFSFRIKDLARVLEPGMV